MTALPDLGIVPQGPRALGCKGTSRDLRNFVWTAAQFVWTNGGNAPGFIPSRYAGSEAATDAGLRLAKRTEWDQKAEDLYVGRGQRLFATDAGEYPLLELRSIEFAAAAAVA